jgi:hypothetical protein
MEDLLKKDSIELFLVIFLPGMISMQVYRLLVAARSVEWKDAVLQAFFYSAINFALCYPILVLTSSAQFVANHPVWFYLRCLLTLLVLPVLWPALFVGMAKTKLFKKHLLAIFPTAWDYFFQQRRSVFVLIHLKDGGLVGGYYGEGSYATAFPDEGDLYICAVYSIDERGRFGPAIPNTNGLLIRKEEYSYLEFFEVPSK